ncbi:MAG: RNB domain-containing ribonuclease, partial [bacterium]
SRLLSVAKARPEIAGVVQTVLLRSLSQAEYSSEMIGHFALAYPVYTHFTSPIRRYPDLVVHRMIRNIIEQRNSRVGPAQASIGEIGEHCSFTERRAEDATRDVVAWLKTEFMQDKVGQSFDGVVSGVKEFGIFVQLDDIFVDGLVHVTALGSDYYRFDPLNFQLVGDRSGRRFRLGDRLTVVVSKVDLDLARIDFELTDAGPQANVNSKTGLGGKSGKKRQVKRPAGAHKPESPRRTSDKPAARGLKRSDKKSKTSKKSRKGKGRKSGK